jgi:hypothetical protein
MGLRWLDGKELMPEFERQVQKVTQEARFYGNKAAKECAEELLEESLKLVPTEKGILASCGEVQRVDNTSSEHLAYRVIYDTRGASNANWNGIPFNYAVIQHETPPYAYAHEHGEWKYLQKPYDKLKKHFQEKMAEEMRNIFKKKSRGKK